MTGTLRVRLLARLALGRAFDPADLLWYVIGIVPLAAIHSRLTFNPT
ncbi:MAG TPA: hypothetical protein VGD29_06390 [Actinoplanes sp.]